MTSLFFKNKQTPGNKKYKTKLAQYLEKIVHTFIGAFATKIVT